MSLPQIAEALAVESCWPQTICASPTKPGSRRRNDGNVESHLYPLVVHNFVIKAMNQAVELGLPKVNAKLVEKV